MRALAKTVGFFLILAAAWLGYRHFAGPITHPPGVLVADQAARSMKRERSDPQLLFLRGSFIVRRERHFCLTNRRSRPKTQSHGFPESFAGAFIKSLIVDLGQERATNAKFSLTVEKRPPL